MAKKIDITLIEPKILPLVISINETNLFRTSSSCQGHFEEEEQAFMDRNHADVRFVNEDHVTSEKAEHFITYLITEYNRRHSFSPITVIVYKFYAPDENYESNYTFVMKLEPFDRFDEPKKKRKDIDLSILQAANIVEEYVTRFAE